MVIFSILTSYVPRRAKSSLVKAPAIRAVFHWRSAMTDGAVPSQTDLCRQIVAIQREYLALYRNALHNHVLSALESLPLSDLRVFLLRQFTQPKLYLPGGAANARPALVHLLDRLLRSIASFWNTRGSRLRGLVRQLDAYTITLPVQIFGRSIESHLRRLGLYFDTCLVVDPLHFSSRDRLEDLLTRDDVFHLGQRLVLLEHARVVVRALSIDSGSMNRPLCVVVPEILNLEEVTFGQEAVTYLSQIFDSPLDPELLSDPNSDLANIEAHLCNQDLYQALILRYSLPDETVWVVDGDTWQLTTDSSDVLSDGGFEFTIRSLVGKLSGTIYSIEANCMAASEYRSDPIVYNGNLPVYRWLLDKGSDELRKMQLPELEESAVAYALTAQQTDFLDAVSDSALRQIREEGVLEELRAELRLDRARFRGPWDDSIEAASSAFVENMVRKIHEFGNEAVAAQRRSRRNLIVGATSLAGSVVLGACSLLLPELLILGVGATAYGIIVGGKSLRDLVTQAIKARRAGHTLLANPMAVLYGAYSCRSGRLIAG